MAILRSLLILLTLALYSGSADAKRFTCDTVDALAELEAAVELAVTIVRNPQRRTCVFWVSVPPSVGLSETPTVEAVEDNFTPALIEALMAPLRDAGYDGSRVENWNQLLDERAKYISGCAYEAIVEGAEFRAFDEVVSCGNLDTGEFVIEARLDELVVTLHISIA